MKDELSLTMEDIKIVEFNQGEDNYTPPEHIVGFFEISRNSMVFSIFQLNIVGYIEVFSCDYNGCKNLYPNMDENNYMLHIEMWIGDSDSMRLATLDIEASKQNCLKIEEFIRPYILTENEPSKIFCEYIKAKRDNC